jgi:hypothetical protein
MKILELMKTHKKGLIIGGLVAVAGAVATVLLKSGDEETEEVVDTVEEEQNEEAPTE